MELQTGGLHCLALLADVDGAADEALLLVALGRCQRNAGLFRPAWRSLMRALTRYRERGDAVGAARATLEAISSRSAPASARFGCSTRRSPRWETLTPISRTNCCARVRSRPRTAGSLQE